MALWLRTSCSSRSQNSILGTHKAVVHNHLLTPILGDPTPSSGLCGYCMNVVHRHTFRQTLKNKTSKLKKK